MAPGKRLGTYDTSIEQEKEEFIRATLEYTEILYTQSQEATTSKSERNPLQQLNDHETLVMTSQKRFSKSLASPEQDREASIQEAAKYAHQVYESTAVNNGATIRTNRHDTAEASLALATGREITCSIHSSKRQSPANTVYSLCSHHMQVLTQVESMGFDRRRASHALRAAYFEPNQAIEYLVNGIPENVQAELLSSLSTTTNQSPTGQPTMKSCNYAMQPISVPATIGRGVIQKSIDGSSCTLPRSLVLRNVRHAATFVSSSATRAGTRHANSSSSYIPEVKKVDSVEMKNQNNKSLPRTKAFQSKEADDKPPNEKTLSDSHLELELRKMLPLNSINQDVLLSDTEFDRIAELLQKAGREEWSFRPRTYVLLRMINAVDLLDDFVKKECLDIELPYSRANLPKSLSPEQRVQFCRNQGAVMTKAAFLESGLKSKHANFLDTADNHMEVFEELGKGGSGQVQRVKSKLSRKFYARKRLKRDETFEKNAEAFKFFKQEVNHLKNLSHRHLVRYVGSYTDPQYVGILMEPVADMNFSQFLGQTSLTQRGHQCVREAFGCLCAAIIYMHLQKVRHKDIKPENILVKQWKVFITDFGIARDWKALGKSTTTGERGPVSIKYAAPEVRESEPRNSSADIWSLGCVYLDMITVLNGETLASKYAYFSSKGNSSLIHSANPEAFQGWIEKLKSKKEKAPLDWIMNMTFKSHKARLSPQQLMDRILTCDDDVYYGICCDGKKEEELAVELRDSENESLSDSEDQSDGEKFAKKVLDLAVLEKQLNKAAHAQDVRMLKRWIRRVPHLNNRGLKTSAIHRAAANGNTEIVKHLVQFGCDLEYRVDGHTPLSTAIWHLREGTTELLAGTKIAINAQEPQKLFSALHTAVQASFRTGMKFLLEAGAMVDISDHNQITPLHIAVREGDFGSVKMLLEHGANISIRDQAGVNVLQLAAASGFESIVKVLLDQKADIDACDTTGKVHQTPLVMAITNKEAAVVRLLLDRKANVNIRPIVNGHSLATPLHQAVARGFLEIVEILLQHNADLEPRDDQDETPLAIACQLPDLRIAKRLLEAGANVDAKIGPIHSILASMVQSGNFHSAQLLIDNKAKMDLHIGMGGTLLHEAVARTNKAAIDFLLKNHFDVDTKDSEGLTALMIAAENDTASTVQSLIDHGASIDIQDRKGNTALHYATGPGSVQAAALLLEHGSDPMIVSKQGFHPVGLAREYEHKEILDLILKALEPIGRVVYDSRWPGMPVCIPTWAMEKGYHVVFDGVTPIAVPHTSFAPYSIPQWEPRTHSGFLDTTSSMRGTEKGNRMSSGD